MRESHTGGDISCMVPLELGRVSHSAYIGPLDLLLTDITLASTIYALVSISKLLHFAAH